MRIIFLGLLFLFSGCAGYELVAPTPDDRRWGPPADIGAQPQLAEDGGLFRRDYMFTLLQDRRAYRVGDILTVVLEERTQSSKRADTSLGKSSSLDIGAPVIGNHTYDNLSASGKADRDFSGSASASQQNTLSGAITVMVTDVMANGALFIRGEKWIRLNQGDEYVRVNGLVRVEDIDLSNRISSQRIADARITYAGRGALAESNQSGWLSRFFSGPLAPF